MDLPTKLLERDFAGTSFVPVYVMLPVRFLFLFLLCYCRSDVCLPVLEQMIIHVDCVYITLEASITAKYIFSMLLYVLSL